MKKDDLIFSYGKKRPWYVAGYTPSAKGVVQKVTTKEVHILWDDARTVSVYPIEKITEHDNKINHLDKEHKQIKIARDQDVTIHP